MEIYRQRLDVLRNDRYVSWAIGKGYEHVQGQNVSVFVIFN